LLIRVLPCHTTRTRFPGKSASIHALRRIQIANKLTEGNSAATASPIHALWLQLNLIGRLGLRELGSRRGSIGADQCVRFRAEVDFVLVQVIFTRVNLIQRISEEGPLRAHLRQRTLHPGDSGFLVGLQRRVKTLRRTNTLPLLFRKSWLPGALPRSRRRLKAVRWSY